jgi:hypothetical protein
VVQKYKQIREEFGMETRKRLAVSGISIIVMLTLLVLAVGIALAQAPNPTGNIDELSEPGDITAVAGAVPIQGQLTDDNGKPLTGGYSVTARIYDASSGGTVLCSDTDPIAVDNGLFTMYLDGANGCSSADIDGKPIYLGIQVGSDPEMTPRQGIYPIPYAWSLRPGAIIRDTTSTILFKVENNGAGTAIVGECDDGYGVYGSSNSWYGVTGTSVSGRGVQGVTNRVDNNYGIYTTDNLYSLNYHLAGAQMQVVQNGGQEVLEAGDVVVFNGMEAGDPPVIRVAKATTANSTAVAGVVYSRYNIAAVTEDLDQSIQADVEVTPTGPVPPGEYLLVVVQGPAQVKASALQTPLHPGDLLSSASQVGYAAKATKVTLDGTETFLPGTILGKALESLDEGEALIYIFVTLQ